MWFSVLSRLGLPYVRSPLAGAEHHHVASPFWAIASGEQSQARQFDSLSLTTPPMNKRIVEDVE